MAEQHKKILSALGLSKEQIDKLESMTADELKELKVEDFTSPVKTNFQTQFLNDDAFLEAIPEEKTSKTVKKNIESSQYARFMNEATDVTKEFALDLSDLTPEEKKSLKGTVRAIIKKAQASGTDSKTLVELQNKLSEALAAKTNAEAGTEKKIADAVAAESKKYGAKLEKSAIHTVLSNIKGLTVKPEYIADMVLNKVKDKFTPQFNPDTMSFELKKKDNPVLDVLKSDGTKQTFNETVLEILKADELWKEPVATPPTPTPTTVQVDGDKTKPVIPDYILKNMNPGLKEETAKAV